MNYVVYEFFFDFDTFKPYMFVPMSKDLLLMLLLLLLYARGFHRGVSFFALNNVVAASTSLNLLQRNPGGDERHLLIGGLSN